MQSKAASVSPQALTNVTTAARFCRLLSAPPRKNKKHDHPSQTNETSDLAVKFGDLQPNQKIAIFRHFLEQLEDKNRVEDWSNIDNWVQKEGKRKEFNGRQIRNVVSTALGIALAGDRKLTREDLATVARQTEDFKKDLATQEAIYRDRQISSRS